MYTLFVILHLMVCFFLIFVVLLQTGKGAQMGAAFGGSSQTLFGTGGASTFLTKLTTISAIVFMITSLLLGVISGKPKSAVKKDSQGPVKRVEKTMPVDVKKAVETKKATDTNKTDSTQKSSEKTEKTIPIDVKKSEETKKVTDTDKKDSSTKKASESVETETFDTKVKPSSDKPASNEVTKSKTENNIEDKVKPDVKDNVTTNSNQEKK